MIDLGVAFGAGLYEHRVVLPRWLSTTSEGDTHWNAGVVRLDDPGRKFWGVVTTLPLTLLTFAVLYAAWNGTGVIRDWCMAAGIAALTDRLFTFAYFIPTMVRLMRMEDSVTAVSAAKRWHRLNYLRHAIVLTAWLLALKAFAVFYQQSG